MSFFFLSNCLFLVWIEDLSWGHIKVLISNMSFSGWGFYCEVMKLIPIVKLFQNVKLWTLILIYFEIGCYRKNLCGTQVVILEHILTKLHFNDHIQYSVKKLKIFKGRRWCLTLECLLLFFNSFANRILSTKYWRNSVKKKLETLSLKFMS